MSSADKRKRYPPQGMAMYTRRWRTKRRAGSSSAGCDAPVQAAIRAERQGRVRLFKGAQQWLAENIKLADLPMLVTAREIGERIPSSSPLNVRSNWSVRHLKALGAVPLPTGSRMLFCTRDLERCKAMDMLERLASWSGNTVPIWPQQCIPASDDFDPVTGEPRGGWRPLTFQERCTPNEPNPPDDAVNDNESAADQPSYAHSQGGQGIDG